MKLLECFNAVSSMFTKVTSNNPDCQCYSSRQMVVFSLLILKNSFFDRLFLRLVRLVPLTKGICLIS